MDCLKYGFNLIIQFLEKILNFTEIEKISSSEEEEVSPLREEKSLSPEIEKEKSPSPPEKSPVPPVPPGNSLSHQPKPDSGTVVQGTVVLSCGSERKKDHGI